MAGIHKAKYYCLYSKSQFDKSENQTEVKKLLTDIWPLSFSIDISFTRLNAMDNISLAETLFVNRISPLKINQYTLFLLYTGIHT